MAKYELAKSVDPMIVDVLERYHPTLHQFGVSVRAKFAWNPEGDEPAVLLHGYPCAAIIEKTNPKMRIWGCPDAIITIDRMWWNFASHAKQEALIDHELTHLELKRDKEGGVVIDDCCRPTLNIRLHDWQMGGFIAVSERHGINALEVEMYQDVAKNYGGMLLNFGEDDSPDGSVEVLAVGGKTIRLGGSEFQD